MDLSLNQTFLKQLADLSFVQRIILYGSRARGDNTSRSDIDLAIVGTPIENKDWQEILTIIDNADTLLKIDFVHYNDLADNNPLKYAIDREGKKSED